MRILIGQSACFEHWHEFTIYLSECDVYESVVQFYIMKKKIFLISLLTSYCSAFLFIVCTFFILTISYLHIALDI